MRYDELNTLDAHLRRLLARVPVDALIDVGAHQGGAGLRFRHAGFHGPIHSFEPVSANYERLTDVAAADASWSVSRVALGSAAGEATINTFPDGDFDSLHEPTGYGAGRFTKVRSRASEVVTVRTLDEVMAEPALAAARRVFLKIDTQGHDLEVVRGGETSIDRIVGLQFELSMKPVYEDAPSAVEALDYALRLGFEVTGLFPITRDRDGLRVVEFDCVMLR